MLGRPAWRGNPTCQRASSLLEAGGFCQWHRHQNIWDYARFCTNICDCIKIKWCSQDCTQGLITAVATPVLFQLCLGA